MNHQTKASCFKFNAEKQLLHVQISTPGLVDTEVTYIWNIADLTALGDKPIIQMTQSEITTYLLWARSEFNPEAMVGQSYIF